MTIGVTWNSLPAKKQTEVYFGLFEEAKSLAGVKEYELHDKHYGRAVGRKITAPFPTTTRRFLTCIHECAHVALRHSRKKLPNHRKELEAENWVFAFLVANGHGHLRSYLGDSRRWVSEVLHKDIASKNVTNADWQSLQFCRNQLSVEVIALIEAKEVQVFDFEIRCPVKYSVVKEHFQRLKTSRQRKNKSSSC